MFPESTRPIAIVYSDDDIVVIDKPPGMLTHSNRFDRASPTVVMVLGSRLGGRVHNVHRLDRMTTGAMVLARNAAAAGELSQQFRDRTVEKTYLAVVRGHSDDEGTVDSPIADSTDGEERDATTSYRTLGRGRVAEPIGRYNEGWFSLVELALHTGRSHQARRHLHRIGHPVVGDNRHADKAYNRWAWERLGERHMFLRAVFLRFHHPADGSAVEVAMGLPAIWRRLLTEVAIELPERYAREGAFARQNVNG
jgi:tRNA pseudouridine65 synthase